MSLPKILATGKFRPEDLEVSVSESNRRIDFQVESKIESAWQDLKKKAEEAGKICYNGISYRLNSIKQDNGKLRCDFGTFEYKVREGLVKIPEYMSLSEDYYRKGCFSCASVKTFDDKYLMVELSGKSINHNTVDLIGGVMETNIGMNTGHDIFQSLYNELEEEAGIKEAEINECYLQTIYLGQGTNIAFYFEVTLCVPASVLSERFKENRDVDIKNLLVLTKNEYITSLRTHKSLNKQLIADLLKI